MTRLKLTHLHLVLAALLSIVLFMNGQPAEAAKIYNSGQLKVLISGSTISAKGISCPVGTHGATGTPEFKVVFGDDGKFSQTSECINTYPTTPRHSEGTWRLDDNQLCLESDDFYFGASMPETGENCMRAQQARFGFELIDGGSNRVWFFQVEKHPKYGNREEIYAALKDVKSTTVIAARPATTSEAAADSAMWESIKYSSQVSDFQRYLETYPNGLFVALASSQIKDLVGRANDPNATTNEFADVDFGKYYALVIGINNYKYITKLGTAVRDAQAVAAVLKDQYGFEVQTLIDPDRADIVDAFDEYRESLTDRDNLLIYYAGHGWLDEQAEEGYWLSAKAKSNRRSQWVSNATITKTLKTLPAKHVMVVADSCYSGTLTRAAAVGFRDADYLKRMARKRARVAMVSGGLEPVADNSGGGNSPFARAFIDALNNNNDVIDGTRLFSEIRRPVILNARQTPEYSDVRNADHDGGDFLFVRKR